MKGKLSQRQVIVLAILVLMVVGCLAAVQMVRSFQGGNESRRQVIDDFKPLDGAQKK